MKIKAITFRKDGFYTQPFAFGGEEGMDKFDPNVRYRGALTNYLIDTGDEVILVDTGLPAGTPEEVPDEKSLIFTGRDVSSYMEAFAALGYRPEQVTKILLTHKHGDHSGELKSFPNAKIFVNADECAADELKGLDNIVPVQFTDGPYYNFPESQTVCDGVHYTPDTGYLALLNNYRQTLDRFVGPTEIFVSGDTLQLKDYGKTDWPWTMFDPAAKQARHETVFPEECRRVRGMGAAMVR